MSGAAFFHLRPIGVKFDPFRSTRNSRIRRPSGAAENAEAMAKARTLPGFVGGFSYIFVYLQEPD